MLGQSAGTAVWWHHTVFLTEEAGAPTRSAIYLLPTHTNARADVSLNPSTAPSRLNPEELLCTNEMYITYCVHEWSYLITNKWDPKFAWTCKCLSSWTVLGFCNQQISLNADSYNCVWWKTNKQKNLCIHVECQRPPRDNVRTTH